MPTHTPTTAPPTVLGTDPDCYFNDTELGAGGGVAKCEEGLELDRCARTECVPPARPPAPLPLAASSHA